MRQLDILEGLGTTTLPASLTVGVRQSHTFSAVVYKSRSWFDLTFSVISEFVGEHAFGVSGTSVSSPASYTVVSGDESTDHDFTLSTAFSVGDVEYDLDGGGFATLISAGGTAGAIPNASLSIGTVVTIRHTSTDSGAQKLCAMSVGGGTKGYAVFTA